MEIDLERQILDAFPTAMTDALRAFIMKGVRGEVFGRPDDDTPLRKMMNRVFKDYAPAIELRMREAVDEMLAGPFLDEIANATRHKITRRLIAQMDGRIGVIAGDLRTNPEFLAKLAPIVAKAVVDFEKEEP